MINLMRPILELSVILPGIMLSCFPVKSYFRQPMRKLFSWILPLFTGLCIVGGVLCYQFRISTLPMLTFFLLVAVILYLKMLRLSLWKSGTVILSVCALFACLNSLSRAFHALFLLYFPTEYSELWLCLWAVILYNAMCWLAVAIAYYPAVHSVRTLIDDPNFAQTWYVFWILPLVFVALNLFMVPHYQDTLYTGRVLQGYFVLSITLLILLLWFDAVFLIMAYSLNRNARLQQENQLLSMQQQRYESLKASIEEVRQARHDMRHILLQLSAFADEGNIEKLRSCLSESSSRIANPDMGLCENRAADTVISYYRALAERESIPFCTELDLPEQLPVNEMDACLVLSNLLENALEASLRTTPARRRIRITAYLHSDSLLLIQVENAYDGMIHEKDGVFQSSKRKGDGIGIRSIQHICEKSGGASTFSYQSGVFCARIMICS